MSKTTVTFIIFGGTGDLTKRKLIPAFGQLLEQNTLSEKSLIIGVGRSEYTHESYREIILESLQDSKERELVSKLRIKYERVDSSIPKSLDALTQKLQTWEDEQTTQRIFYLATTYKIFPNIIQNIQHAQLAQTTKETKIVFEKPFGHDYTSAKKLEEDIHAVFEESQIYRIDHYLGKETVQNLTVFKFANPIINAILNGDLVEKIDVFVDENLSVKDRLGYYDGAGSLKDMIQSHLLQVLALVLMERPTHLSADCIHDEKVEILKQLTVLPAKHHILGQYEGYSRELTEAGFLESRTDTFSYLALSCNTKRWKGVDIALQTGKNLDKKEGKIIIHFKSPQSEFLGDFKHFKENKLVIDIHPQEDITLFFNTKKRFSSDTLERVDMDFCGNCHFGPNTTDGYMKLLQDILLGDKTLFIRNDELLESWKIVDTIRAIKKDIVFVTYPKGSSGKEIIALAQKQQNA